MKFLSLRILILCILLPPVLYIFSVQSIERHLKSRYANEIEDIYLEDTRPLFEGSIRLKDAINRNINRYLQSKALIAFGVKVAATVTSKQNTILYPAVVDAKESSLLPNDSQLCVVGFFAAKDLTGSKNFNVPTLRKFFTSWMANL